MAWIAESAVTAVMLMVVTLQLDTAAVWQAGQVSCVFLCLRSGETITQSQ